MQKRQYRDDAPCDRSRSVVAHAGCDLREDWPSGSRWISLRRRGVRLTGGSLLISFGTGTSARFVTAGPSVHRSFASLPAARSLDQPPPILLILSSAEPDSSRLHHNRHSDPIHFPLTIGPCLNPVALPNDATCSRD